MIDDTRPTLAERYEYKPPGVPIPAGELGHNEYGVPLHACNEYRHDAHYWDYWAWRALKGAAT